MRYVPALDGLRALAALVVVLFHAEVPGFRGGYMGVDVFFVLSGYLITRLLVEQRPDLWTFYARRAKRLYPALLLMLLVFVWAGGAMRDALLAGLYLTDFTRAIWQTPMSLTHTWSLSVEEQFYLLWPVVLYAALRRFPIASIAKAMLWTTIALLLWRLFWMGQGASWDRLYFSPDTHATGLALGCTIGLARIELSRWTGWIGVALLLSALALFPVEMQSLMGLPLAEIGTALIIAGNWQPPLPLAYIGRLSYGWYLWHFPLLKATHAWAASWPTQMAIGIGGGLLLAALSYHTVEARFRSASRSKRLHNV